MSPSGARRRFHRNAPGDFYVEDQMCITCAAPESVAPDLVTGAMDGHCYFARQPRTEAQLTAAIEAVSSSCCKAVRYGGSDPEILRRLRLRGCRFSCDAFTPAHADPTSVNLLSAWLALWKFHWRRLLRRRMN